MARTIDGEAILNMMSSFDRGERGGSTAKRILLATGLSGMIIAGAIAPGLLRVMGPIVSENGARPSKRVLNALHYLKKNGLVIVSQKKDGTKKIILSDSGRDRLMKYHMQSLKIRTPILWDRMWRVVIFDIPIEKNAIRIQFRAMLQRMGFRQVQKSVWIFPYKCEDEVFFLAKALHIDEYVDILVVKKFYDKCSKFKEMFFK